MERELWPPLYQMVREVAAEVSQKYVQYQPWVLAAVFLWAALHDRPISWACQKRHWSTTTLRPARLPSPATISRRINSAGLALFWRMLQERLQRGVPPVLVAFLDGKPLPIGGSSKDRDAKRGRGAGGMAKGYKLHAIWSNGPIPDAWDIAALNVHERQVARQALLPQLRYGGYLLADGHFDASDLFDQAATQDYQMLIPIPAGKNPGSGKHYQSPYRLRSIQLQRGEFGRSVYRARTAIERLFGNATTFGGGLGPLPAWVRGLRRVRTWVWAKLLINAVRASKRQYLRQA
jgi:hypothetical protein